MQGIAAEFKLILAFAILLQSSIFSERFLWSHKRWRWDHRGSHELMRSFVDALFYESFIDAAVLLAAYFMN